MEQIRVKSESIIKIQVNDDGEYIEINTEDVELPLKLENVYEKIQKLASKYKAKEAIISKQADEKGKYLLSKNELARVNMLKEYYADARKIVDELFGDCACDKIFGSHNYPSMFNDLFTQLDPIFKQAGIKAKTMKDAVIAKYSENKDEELS